MHTWMHAYTCMHAHKHACLHAGTHACMHICTHTHMHKYTHTDALLHALCAHVHMHAHTHTHTLTHHHHHHHYHHHQSLNHEGQWGTTDDFSTSFLNFFLFSTALWDLLNSRPVHSMMLSSHLFLCLPCLLPPFTVSCKMVFAKSDEWETWPYHCSLRLFAIVRRSSCGPIACWILVKTSSLVTWSLYEMCSILR